MPESGEDSSFFSEGSSLGTWRQRGSSYPEDAPRIRKPFDLVNMAWDGEAFFLVVTTSTSIRDSYDETRQSCKIGVKHSKLGRWSVSEHKKDR